MEIIAREAKANGAVTFARFMELALYHPEHGYYERGPGQVGKQGDFYTSVSVGPLFGELLAFQFAQWLAQISDNVPRNEKLRIVEAGAHDGRLAKDILGAMRERRPEIFERTEYWIFEPSQRRQAWQKESLIEYSERIRWAKGPFRQASHEVAGIIFANELLDAFPARRLGWDRRGQVWFEWGVGMASDRLRWLRLPIKDPTDGTGGVPNALRALPVELLDVLPDGFSTESCPAAEAWWSGAARTLKSGWLLTLDYGLQAGEFLAPSLAEGTVRAFRDHHQVKDLLANPGEQDLTADVNFSALQAAGEAAGLVTESFGSQAQFLTSIFHQTLADEAGFPPWTPARVRQFQTLTHPEHLGRAFRVMVQTRGK
ncbi:MAG TPA: SAM-dependent methyltransferase [Verrucomicrobiae bacterium]|nr:SAM-dependent methyltransferase [Verrucomicrobiae bacterium]